MSLPDMGGRAAWRGHAPVKRELSGRACGARPSAGGPCPDERPCGENPGIMRGAIFSEGRGLRARVARPEASRGIPFPPHALRMSQWPRGGNVGVGVMPSLRACGTRPSAGLVIRARMASRGKAGNNVEGGFLGGTRSARPQMRAGRKPRENIFMGGKRWPGGLMGPSLVESEVSLTGVRSPPLRGGQARHGWPCGEVLEMTRKAIFSEGRTLCVRVVRP